MMERPSSVPGNTTLLRGGASGSYYDLTMSHGLNASRIFVSYLINIQRVGMLFPILWQKRSTFLHSIRLRIRFLSISNVGKSPLKRKLISVETAISHIPKYFPNCICYCCPPTTPGSRLNSCLSSISKRFATMEYHLWENSNHNERKAS